MWFIRELMMALLTMTIFSQRIRAFSGISIELKQSLNRSEQSYRSIGRLRSLPLDSAHVIEVPKKFKPYPFAYHEVLTLEVESLTNLGVGVCRIDIDVDDNNDEAQLQQHSGEDSKIELVSSLKNTQKKWVVFVPGTIPGETVEARVFRNHKSYSDADLLGVVTPSSLHTRVEPLCPIAGECGGCQYQHVSVPDQRRWKTQQVSELLQRIGNFEIGSFPPVKSTVGTDETYGYRSKLTPHYNRPDKKTGLIDAVGFQKTSARVLIDVPQCAIATPAINEKYKEVRNDVFCGNLKSKKNKGATLLLRDANEGVVTDPNQYVTTNVDDLTFRFLAGNFFQNNPYMLPVMTKYVVDAAVQESPSGVHMTHLIDCYCGSGLFCLSSAKHFKLCAGIEINDRAIEEATANAKLNSIDNCVFVAASAEAIFESEERIKLRNEDGSGTLVSEFPRESTVVVLDPPRKGCSEEFLEQLYKYRPQRIVYMSCDPATQARDAAGIVANGYELVSTQPFDLFPQTRHIECLCVFEKLSK